MVPVFPVASQSLNLNSYATHNKGEHHAETHTPPLNPIGTHGRALIYISGAKGQGLLSLSR
jgi:hypothetical protein